MGDQTTEHFRWAEPEPERLSLALANRHGLISRRDGNRQDRALQVLAEGFPTQVVSVLRSDIKGDLSVSPSRARGQGGVVTRDQESSGIDLRWTGSRCILGFVREQGHPIRATIFRDGAASVVASHDLNEVQEGGSISASACRRAGALLLDLKDLRSMLGYIASMHRS